VPLASSSNVSYPIFPCLISLTFLVLDRYWGKSSPYPDLTTANLKYLNLDQAMADHKYFIENVVLPWGASIQSHPDQVPWVQIGCSYP
jgi:hypothetical protein